MPEETTVEGQPTTETETSTVTETPETSTAVEGTEAEPSSETTSEGESRGTSSLEERIQALTPEHEAVYKKRYPNLWELAHDPSQPDDVRAILLDKINDSDEIKKYRTASTTEETIQDEPIFEDETPADETATATQVEPIAPAEAEKRYYTDLESVVSRTMRPEAVVRLGEGLLKLLGADSSALSDPKATPEQKAHAWQVKQAAPELGKFLAVSLADGVKALLPTFLPQVMEGVAPGYQDAASRTVWQGTWQGIRGWTAKDGTKPFSDLPAFDTQEFQQAALKVASKFPGGYEGFDAMPLYEKNGSLMAPRKAAFEKMKWLAGEMRGNKGDPVAMANLIDKGKKLQADADRRTRAGQVLNSGQSKKEMTPGTGKDAFKDAIKAHNEGRYS